MCNYRDPILSHAADSSISMYMEALYIYSKFFPQIQLGHSRYTVYRFAFVSHQRLLTDPWRAVSLSEIASSRQNRRKIFRRNFLSQIFCPFFYQKRLRALQLRQVCHVYLHSCWNWLAHELPQNCICPGSALPYRVCLIVSALSCPGAGYLWYIAMRSA